MDIDAVIWMRAQRVVCGKACGAAGDAVIECELSSWCGSANGATGGREILCSTAKNDSMFLLVLAMGWSLGFIFHLFVVDCTTVS